MTLKMKKVSKVSVFLGFVLIADFGSITYGGLIEDRLTEAAECIRQHLQNGYPEIGLPSFDPLEIEQLDVAQIINNSYIPGDLLLNQLLLSGIPKFYLTGLSGTLGPQVKINFTINVDNITVNSKYFLDSQLHGFLDVYGKGDIRFEVSLASVFVGMSTPLIGGNSTYNLNLNIGDIKVAVTGLFNNDDLSTGISNSIQDILLEIVEVHGSAINEQLTSIIEEAIGDLGWGDLFDLLRTIISTCDSE